MAKRLVRWGIEGETLVNEIDEERSCELVQALLGSTMIDANTPLEINDRIYGTRTTVKQSEIEILSSELVDRGNK